MSITVELTYDMAKALGERRFCLEGVRTLAEVLHLTRQHFETRDLDFDQLTRVTGIVVNGVLIHHKQGLGTPLQDGDRVGFMKAAAGG
jgi:molybdopterin converting factor small subunit